MIYKAKPQEFIGDKSMECPNCGFAMVKNGKRELKYRGVLQNFCVRGVESSLLTAISSE
jgi:hypothetical protein